MLAARSWTDPEAEAGTMLVLQVPVGVPTCCSLRLAVRFVNLKADFVQHASVHLQNHSFAVLACVCAHHHYSVSCTMPPNSKAAAKGKADPPACKRKVDADPETLESCSKAQKSDVGAVPTAPLGAHASSAKPPCKDWSPPADPFSSAIPTLAKLVPWVREKIFEWIQANLPTAVHGAKDLCSVPPLQIQQGQTSGMKEVWCLRNMTTSLKQHGVYEGGATVWVLDAYPDASIDASWQAYIDFGKEAFDEHIACLYRCSKSSDLIVCRWLFSQICAFCFLC